MSVLCFLVAINLFGINLASGFNFSSKSARIRLTDPNASLNLKTNISNYAGTFEITPGSANTVSNTGSQTINFSNGYILSGNVASAFSGSFNPTASDSLSLTNGSILDTSSGTIPQSITVMPAATATIFGQPQFSSAITLGSSSSVLQLDIASTLNQSITGSGFLSLLNDLTVCDSVGFPSNVQQNNKKISLNGGTYSSPVSFSTGGQIEIGGPLTLSSTWTIGTGGDNYTITGNGNVITLSGSGSIIFNGATLHLSGIHIKGLSASNLSGTGTIKMSNTTLELTGNYTRIDGNFAIEGSNCKVVTNGNSFSIGNNKLLLIDHEVLYYDQLSTGSGSPFVELNGSGSNIIMSNGGAIQQINGTSGGGGGGGGGGGSVAAIFSGIFTSNSTTMTGNVEITSSSIVHFINGTPGSPYTLSVNGDGHSIRFGKKAGTFVIDAYAQAALTNVILQNFNSSIISYGDTNSTLTYSDNVYISFLENQTIDAAEQQGWIFNGSSTIDGNGAVLTINKSQGITIVGNKTLTLRNMKIICTASDGFACLTSDAKICLENVILETRDNNFNFALGNLEIIEQVKLNGSSLASNPATRFEFSSTGNLVIGSVANSKLGTLYIGPNVTLKYNANPAGQNTVFASKRHLQFAYPASNLYLDGGTLQSTTTGIALEAGTLTVDNGAKLISSTATAAQAEIKSNMILNFMADAVLDVQGPLIYIQ